MKKELTLQDAFVICKQLWTWCARTGLPKELWPEWGRIRKEYGLSFSADCAFCQYSVDNTVSGGCLACPLMWHFANCYETYFNQWDTATTRTDRMKYAQLFLGQIEVLEKLYKKNNFVVDIV